MQLFRNPPGFGTSLQNAPHFAIFERLLFKN
jgi:hypothetical protein